MSLVPVLTTKPAFSWGATLRIAAKKLRYAMEIERELKRSRATARIGQLKRLQDLLGRMHDFHVLSEQTRAVQAEVARTDRRLAGELDILIRAIEDECRRDHATYVRRRESIRRLCDNPTLGSETRPSAVA